MDNYGSHDIYEFLHYCKEHNIYLKVIIRKCLILYLYYFNNIIPLVFPSHTTHLL